MKAQGDAQRGARRYRLRPAGEAEDGDRRLWGKVYRRGWVGRARRSLDRWGAAIPPLAACAIAAAWLWLNPAEVAEAKIRLAATVGGVAGAPASDSERTAVMAQVRDRALLEQVARNMRLYRSAPGATVADRTAAAARQALEGIVVAGGDDPGVIEVSYVHRNPAHAVELLNTLGEIFVAQRGALESGTAGAAAAENSPAEELGQARRALAEFLSLNPASRIEPQRRQNEARIAELEAEIVRVDEALASLGQGEAARSLAARRTEFEGMIRRHRSRLEELDRLEMRRRQLERRVEMAEAAIEDPSAAAPSTPVTLTATHVTVLEPASVEMSAADSWRGSTAIALLILGVLAGYGVARGGQRRRRRAANTGELAAAAGAPVLVLAEESPADVS